jgi:hypothetical protein
LHLDGVTKADFRQLLRVMFLPINHQQVSFANFAETNSGNQSISSMSWRDWASIYLLSNMWGMEKMRDKALQNISTLPADADEWVAVLRLSTAWRLSNIRQKAIQSLNGYNIDDKVMVEVAKDCKVSDLLLRGYRGFVRRKEEISVEEAEWLGWETTLRLLRIRDQYLSSPPSYASDRRYNPDSDLRRAFHVELKGFG